MSKKKPKKPKKLTEKQSLAIEVTQLSEVIAYRNSQLKTMHEELARSDEAYKSLVKERNGLMRRINAIEFVVQATRDRELTDAQLREVV